MKRLLLIICGLLIVSCANETRSMKYEAAEVSDYDEAFYETNYSFETISEQKLKEYFDLLKLKQAHPDFKEDIVLQLKKFSSDSTIGLNYPKDFSIENISQVGPMQRLSDSVQHIKLSYDVVGTTKTFKDSILVIISQKNIRLDSEVITSTQIRFDRIKD